MVFEEGVKVLGIVLGIMNFGVFIDLVDNKMGFVYIS